MFLGNIQRIFAREYLFAIMAVCRLKESAYQFWLKRLVDALYTYIYTRNIEHVYVIRVLFYMRVWLLDMLLPLPLTV